jgi:hypothetical protein
VVCGLAVFMATRRSGAAGWSLDARGRATFGATSHLTGGTVDIVGAPRDSAGLSVLVSDWKNEGFFLQEIQHPITKQWFKTMSISSIWDDSLSPVPRASMDRIALTRYNSTTIDVNGVIRDDVGMVHCGGHGTVFYPYDNQRPKECPPEPNAVAMTGNLYLRKDLYVTGRIFVNGVEIR